MPKLRPFIVLLLTILPLSSISASTPEWSELRETVRAEMESLAIPGAAVAVIVDGEVAFAEGFGLADVAAKKPITAETRFRIGSLTKMFSAATIVSLRNEPGSVLDLNSPVRLFDPTLPERIGGVTLDQLLMHRAGLADRIREQPLSDDDLLAPPGEVFSYSSLGYSVAARAVAAATGKPFDELLRRQLFAPLKMTSTGYLPDPLLDSRGYRRRRGRAVPVEYMEREELKAAGFMYSNLNDLSRFAVAFLADRLPGVASTELAGVRTTVPGDTRRYGYGAMLDDEGGERVVFHSGDEPGGSSFLKMVPSKRVAVIVVSNLMARMPKTIETALRLSASIEPVAKTQPKPGKLTEEDVAELVGRYDNSQSLAIRRSRKGATLGPDFPWFLRWIPLKRNVVKFAEDDFGVFVASVGPDPIHITPIRGESGTIDYIFIRGRAFKRYSVQ
jgi:serine beta-lactamase-like protein LACTB